MDDDPGQGTGSGQSPGQSGWIDQGNLGVAQPGLVRGRVDEPAHLLTVQEGSRGSKSGGIRGGIGQVLHLVLGHGDDRVPGRERMPPDILVVTFTEAATAELRGRLRAALGHTLAHLSGDDDHHPDAVIDALGSDPTLRSVYARRVGKALAELDTAWITTIHGWCARVLGSAGVWQATQGTLVQDDDDVTETLHDVLVARYALSGDLPAEVADIARAVRIRLAMPLAVMQRIEPHDLSNATAAKQRKLDEGLQRVERADELVQLVDDIVAEVANRRRRSGRQTFDGLLEETRNLLFGPRHGEVIDGLRSRFEVVLIDEFQDTDQMQWDIFRRAFHDPSVSTAPGALRRLVLVGDPKQSIYRFRAAELSAYLQARHAAGAQVRTLRINRRSDPAVLSGVEHLLQGTTYGDEAVRFEPVRAPEGTPRSRLYGLPGPALQLRRVDGVPTDMTSLRRAVRSDVAFVVNRLLASGLELDDASVEGARRPLRPAPWQHAASDVRSALRDRAAGSQRPRARQGIRWSEASGWKLTAGLRLN